jgi:hypothetical protein
MGPALSLSESDSEISTSNTQPQGRVVSSFIWNYGSKVTCSNGSPGWKCAHCGHLLPSLGSTSNQLYHLRKKHGIEDNEKSTNKQQTTLDGHILRPF